MGETLKHFTLRAGDGALADRGDAHAQGREEAGKPGADIIVWLNPFRGVLGDANGQPMSLGRALKRQPPETIRTLPVLIQASGGQAAVQGWVHAYRCSAEQAGRARHTCWQRHKKGAPKAE